MIRTAVHSVVALLMVTVAGGGPTLADAVHGAAHAALADHHADLDDHHDAEDHHDGQEHHRQDPPADDPRNPADWTVDHAQPEHPHADADQLRSSSPTDVATPPGRRVVVATLMPLRQRPPAAVDPIPLQSSTAARPPTRAPPRPSV
ncbi:MAG: hypothetical protein ACKVZ0_15295 [Gemmatimonadales bacterium]